MGVSGGYGARSEIEVDRVVGQFGLLRLGGSGGPELVSVRFWREADKVAARSSLYRKVDGNRKVLIFICFGAPLPKPLSLQGLLRDQSGRN